MELSSCPDQVWTTSRFTLSQLEHSLSLNITNNNLLDRGFGSLLRMINLRLLLKWFTGFLHFRVTWSTLDQLAWIYVYNHLACCVPALFSFASTLSKPLIQIELCSYQIISSLHWKQIGDVFMPYWPFKHRKDITSFNCIP